MNELFICLHFPLLIDIQSLSKAVTCLTNVLNLLSSFTVYYLLAQIELSILQVGFASCKTVKLVLSGLDFSHLFFSNILNGISLIIRTAKRKNKFPGQTQICQQFFFGSAKITVIRFFAFQFTYETFCNDRSFFGIQLNLWHVKKLFIKISCFVSII